MTEPDIIQLLREDCHVIPALERALREGMTVTINSDTIRKFVSHRLSNPLPFTIEDPA